MEDVFKLNVRDQGETNRWATPDCTFIMVVYNPEFNDYGIVVTAYPPLHVLINLPKVDGWGWHLDYCYEVPSKVYNSLRDLIDQHKSSRVDLVEMIRNNHAVTLYNRGVLTLLETSLRGSVDGDRRLWEPLIRARRDRALANKSSQK